MENRSNVIGHPNARLSVRERFEMKVDRSGTCHRWTGAIRNGPNQGYGEFWYQGRARRAHVVALILADIDVPAGQTVDHVWSRGCRYRDCVRIDHLEVVSNRENILRGNNPAAQNARKTRCKYGHELVPDYTKSRANRRCPTCARYANRVSVDRRAS